MPHNNEVKSTKISHQLLLFKPVIVLILGSMRLEIMHFAYLALLETSNKARLILQHHATRMSPSDPSLVGAPHPVP